MIPEFAKIDALPCSQIQFSVCDRYGNRLPDDRSLDMSGHVVRSLQRVCQETHVFRYQFVEKRFKVVPHRRVRILVQGESGRSMLYQQVYDPGCRERRQILQYIPCYKMIAPPERWHVDFDLLYHILCVSENRLSKNTLF